ncbi:MAG: hypothetical protein E6F96_04970 [Actinobacteria bacterium]|nr:MAG: hypothetical protein E6F96_04970 [Actinomycetota bacterium]
MYERDVEILREGLQAFSDGDIERILQFTHPEFEAIVPAELSPEPDTYRGHDGVRRYFASFAEAMEDIHFQPERFWDAGDAVVVAMRMTAKGRQTSIEVEQRFAQIWTLLDDKARSVRTFSSVRQALEAAGLAS